MIIALNNKSNLGKEEFQQYMQELEKIECQDTMILCPNHLNINSYSSKKCHLGAQNVSRTGNGAYTGEISSEQLKSYNVEYCIIGHSERRQYQKESLEDIHEKLLKLIENQITPILCIGESLEERNNNKVEEVLKKELLTAVEGLTDAEKEKIIIAYEPIWSIGTGIIPTNEQIKEVFHLIKTLLPNIKVLYGGSANEENIDVFREIKEIDGYLLGGLSLKPEKLKIFIEKCH